MSIAARVRRLAARVERLEAAARPVPVSDPLLLAGQIGLVPDVWQVRALRSTAQTLLLCASRQSGKSTIVALLIVATLLQPGRTVVIISPSERQSKELHRKVLSIWRGLGRPVAHAGVTRTNLELVNGSRLEAFPSNEDTIRGISAVDLLVAEEAAMVPDDVFNAVSPMLAVSDGRLVAPSTPKGKRGWWYGLWAMPEIEDPDIERILLTAEQCPRISPQFLARERRRVGQWWFDQEYRCIFQESAGQLVGDEDLAAALTPAVAPLFAS